MNTLAVPDARDGRAPRAAAAPRTRRRTALPRLEAGRGAVAEDRAWEAGLRRLSAGLDRLGQRVVLFRRGQWLFASFGLFGGLGALVATAGTGAVLVGQGFAPERFAALAGTAGCAVIAGSWLLGQLLEFTRSQRPALRQLRRPVFVSWGGLLGLLLTLGLGAGGSPRELLQLLDALARALFVGHALGRLGCLSYGCCFGRPTRGPLAITYRDPRAKAVRVGGRRGVPLHPAALYEATLECALALAVNAAALAGAPLGVPAALAACGYGVVRFAVEFLREPADEARRGALSLNQRIALLTLAAGLALGATAALGGGAAPPPFDAGALPPALPWLLASSLTAGAVVFLGFSLHRGEIGRW